MAVVGVDVSKDTLAATRVSSGGIVKERYELDNTESAILEWLNTLKRKHKHLVVASEATGDYHNLLAKCCLSLKISFRLLNPILTNQFSRGTIRHQKTDLTDAEIIAKLVLQNEGYEVNATLFVPARAIHRTCIRLAKVRHALELMTKRFKEMFPEEKEAEAIISGCLNSLDQGCVQLRSLARSKTDPKLVKLLTSITGIGEHVAMTMVNEIGDINRFPTQKSLIAYAGLDPRVKQSGTSLKHNTHITKRGSPYLRRDIFIAASIASLWDPDLKEYHQKKKSEGKRYREATVATARRLLNRVYAVWKRGTPYEKRPITT